MLEPAIVAPAIRRRADQIVWLRVTAGYYGSSTAKMTSLKCHCGETKKKKILQNMPISYSQINVQSHFIQGQFWPSGIVVPCVCLSVCVSVNHELVVRGNGDNSSSVQVGIAKFR